MSVSESEDLLFNALTQCNLERHFTALVTIGIHNADHLLVFGKHIDLLARRTNMSHADLQRLIKAIDVHQHIEPEVEPSSIIAQPQHMQSNETQVHIVDETSWNNLNTSIASAYIQNIADLGHDVDDIQTTNTSNDSHLNDTRNIENNENMNNRPPTTIDTNDIDINIDASSASIQHSPTPQSFRKTKSRCRNRRKRYNYLESSQSESDSESDNKNTRTLRNKLFICYECNSKFIDEKSKDKHRSKCHAYPVNIDKYVDEQNSCYDDDDELKEAEFNTKDNITDISNDDEPIIHRIKRKQSKRRLNDDMKKKQKRFEVQKKALRNKARNPEGYYYRFLDEKERQKKGGWSDIEHRLFIERVKEVGVNEKWGLFSTKIPGRVGYQCSSYWRTLIRRNMVRDSNYFKNKKGEFRFKWHRTLNTGNKIPKELLQHRKWSFVIHDVDGNIVFKHQKYQRHFKIIEHKYEKWFRKEYKEYIGKERNDNDRYEPPRKKRRTT